MLSISRSFNNAVLAVIFLLALTTIFEVNHRTRPRHEIIWEHNFPANGSPDTESSSAIAQGWMQIYRGSRLPLLQVLSHGNLAQVSHANSIQPDKSRLSVNRVEYMKDMLKWNRPNKEKAGQWPLYRDFVGKTYDSYRWQAFPQERGYYTKTGTKHLRHSKQASEHVYHPYTRHEPSTQKDEKSRTPVPCEGPRGKLLNESAGDMTTAYNFVPAKIPMAFAGSARAINLHSNICLNRLQRYGPYGLSQSKVSPANAVLWDRVQWGELQTKCIERNYAHIPVAHTGLKTVTRDPHPKEATGHTVITKTLLPQSQRARTAILLRSWEGYNYSANDIMNIRAMITELSLNTGGEYQVFLFVNVKDRTQNIHSDPLAYSKVLRKVIPIELQDITILWSEDISQQLYPQVGNWQVHWQQYMPVQWFSKLHPEFEHIWNWEMDVRYTGNYFHLLDRISTFAKQQPRKYLWERNARLYIPSFHGSSYDSFVQNTNRIIEQSSAEAKVVDAKIAIPVWGPQPYSNLQRPLGPHPPHPQELDDFQWGVNEDADLVTLLPIFDPVNTKWEMRHNIWNFSPGIKPKVSASDSAGYSYSHPAYANLSRRAYINTTVRLSRNLLHAMHTENKAGRSMQAEMWPSTVALHHGFKAVYAPHPIYSERQWPARYADAVFNADGGIAGRWSQEGDSVYNRDREANFRSFSWYFDALFPKVLYRRWMGWEAEDENGVAGGKAWEDGKDGPGGKMCLPPMLLHPIKRKDLEDG